MTVTERIILLDAEVLEPMLDRLLTFGDIQVRQPDFIDATSPVCIEMKRGNWGDEAPTAVWIGEDGAVEVPIVHVDMVARLARSAEFMARSGRSPQEFGIAVSLHDPEFVHPAAKFWASGASAFTTWVEFAEIVGLRDRV